MFKFLYNKNDVYKPTYRLYHYQDNLYRLCFFNCRQKGFENKKSFNRFVEKSEVERISLSRTKRNIREICCCNNFKYFCTFTINSKYNDRFNLQQLQNTLSKTLHNYSRLKSHTQSFKYIFITEKHKDGAFHFHGLVTSLATDYLYTNSNGYLSDSYLDSTFGYCSFSLIKDTLRTANYITKYITKNCVKNENNQIYFCSKGLKRAEVSQLSADAFINSSILDSNFWTFENDYCKIKDFCFDNLNSQQQTVIFKNSENFT